MTAEVESLPTPPCDRQASPALALEAVFRRIAGTRMAGIGLLNPALEVEAVGFRRWQGDWVGVLVTPWFMNLICLPGPDAAWEAGCSGSRRDVELPSGSYEFLTADEDELGPYLTCSLFSPMFEFPDMARARAVAEAVLAEIFAPSAPEPAPAPEGLAAKVDQPVSRRGFLGAFLKAGDAA